MVKRMNKLYMITVNNKRYSEWVKQTQIKLKRRKNRMALDHFNAGHADISDGNYLARASFVCYWEIYANNNLSRIAPAITQATLIHMLHRLIEMGKHEEVEIVSQIMTNFLRLLAVLDSSDPSDEEE
jgi:hypothetical protein